MAGAQTYRFSSVSVEGNALIDDDTIVGFARIARNRSMSGAELNAAYQRVAGTGFFRSVDFRPAGNRLVISVEEYPVINRVAIEGNRRLNDERLSAVAQSRAGGVYSPAQAEADANAMAQAYADAGRLSATVTPRLIERAGGRVDLVFEVAEGQVVEIERISFVGNRTFTERRLRNAISTNQAGRLSTLFRADNYNAQRIAQDRQTLQDFYLSRGFIDAQVLSGVTELSRERDGAYVTFTIREGQQYRVGHVTVVSEIDGIDPAAYQAALTDRTGQLFTPTVMETMIQQVERVGYESGQRFVRADTRLHRNERDGTIDVELALVRGERVFIERIDIQGNATTQDQVIRRQFAVAEGDPLNPRELREAASRIRDLGYFSDVQVNPTQGSSAEQAVVDVQVEETSTGSLGFGLTYGSNGVGGNVSYNETNFLGRGQRLNLTFSTVPNQQAFSVDFSEPALLGRDLAFGLNMGLTSSSANGASTFFDSRSLSFSPSLTFPVSDYGRMSVRYSLSQTEITVPAAYAANIATRVSADAGRALTSSVGFTYTYDTRVNGPNPDRGFVFRFAGDVAGLGGDRRWARSTVLAGYRQQVMDGAVTLSAEFEAGAIAHQSGPSRINERFGLNSDQMRGFDSFGLGPVAYGAAATDRNGLGGNFFAVARFEARFPLGLPSEYNVRGGLFLDVGSIWGVDSPAMAACPGNVAAPNCYIDDQSLRAAAGVAVFWGSPMGLLRFNFAVPLRRASYDQVRRFDLTIASQF
ncbi:MAG: outer membrane protein assembly factor BamA [Rhodobacter sp.]|uniref:outer membrane protein assembly factor BamA n=1 Tax=Pararhodobacter sp. TaxID=2127056 RepID=UPI001D973F66|nr:outer membrane protein assembly factor BamA [Pararhodobacter sp.]MCB1346471.1 outer membrane protein assembly factor BamA [Paracoccaceae bacterium]MCC0073668.1 outer membrane protein assembly factor BamA [Rhodobacter sp.]HPD92255.1 outer membrane protein assembly factor BamA [Pararhodobacter sp.]